MRESAHFLGFSPCADEVQLQEVPANGPKGQKEAPLGETPLVEKTIAPLLES